MIPSIATRVEASGNQVYETSSRIEADNIAQGLSIYISCLSLSVENIMSVLSRNTLSNRRYVVDDLISIGSCLAKLIHSGLSNKDELFAAFLTLINVILSGLLLSIQDSTQVKLLLRMLCRTISDALLSASKTANQPPRKILQDVICVSLHKLCSSSRQDPSAWKLYKQYLESIIQAILLDEPLLASYERDLQVRKSQSLIANLINV